MLKIYSLVTLDIHKEILIYVLAMSPVFDHV
jgi:hypothetical protein